MRCTSKFWSVTPVELVSPVLQPSFGRFLPRLGPFGNSNGPFSFSGHVCSRDDRSDGVVLQSIEALLRLLGRRPATEQARQFDHHSTHHAAELCPEPVEGTVPLEGRLVHVERTVDFDLQCMETTGRAPIMLGDETLRSTPRPIA